MQNFRSCLHAAQGSNLLYLKQRLMRQAWEILFRKNKRSILCQKVAKRVGLSKNLRPIREVLIVINSVRTIKQSVSYDDFK